MPEPFLHLGDVGLVRKRVSCGRGAERVHAQSIHLDVDAGFEAIMAHGCCGTPKPDRAADPGFRVCGCFYTGPPLSAPCPARTRHSSMSRCAAT